MHAGKSKTLPMKMGWTKLCIRLFRRRRYPRNFAGCLLGLWISKTVGKKMGLLIHRHNPEDLQYLCSHYETGKLVPIIDWCFKLNEVPEAMKHFGEGHFMGKIVIVMAE